MAWRVVFRDTGQQRVEFNNADQRVDGPESTFQHEAWHTEGVGGTVVGGSTAFKNRASQVGVRLMPRSALPQNPTENDYEIKIGYVNEADHRIRTRIFNDLKNAEFDPARDPEDVALEIIQRWVVGTQGNNAPELAILNAGIWHVGGHGGNIHLYPKP